MAVILLDRVARLGGLAHVVLPDSRGRDRHVPGKYADTAIPALVAEPRPPAGPARPRVRLAAKLVGGAVDVRVVPGTDIGRLNVEAAERILEGLGIPVARPRRRRLDRPERDARRRIGRRARSASPAARPTTSEPARPTAAGRGTEPMKRLLIVDDALIMRKMIRDVAEAAGWEVVGEAADGREAVEAYRSLRPDLVTLDLVMPVMGGLDALREIRAGDPEARVVVVTALGQKEMVAAVDRRPARWTSSSSRSTGEPDDRPADQAGRIGARDDRSPRREGRR